MICCLIIAPRIRFAAPRMSWTGVGLLKLGFFWRDLSPRDFICCGKRRLWSHHPCGKLWWGCLCVHGMSYRICALWKKADVVHIWMPGGLGLFLLLWLVSAVWEEGGSLIPEGVISPLSEAVEQEWVQKCSVLHFGNAHGAQGSQALGWSCHLLAFAGLGGGTLKSKSPKSRRMSFHKLNDCTQSRVIISRDRLKVLIRPALLWSWKLRNKRLVRLPKSNVFHGNTFSQP